MDTKNYEVRSLLPQISYKIDFKIYANTCLMVTINNTDKLLEAYGARSREGELCHRSVYDILHELEDQVRKEFFGARKLQGLHVVEDHGVCLDFLYRGCYQMGARDYAVFYEFINPKAQSDHE